MIHTTRPCRCTEQVVVQCGGFVVNRFRVLVIGVDAGRRRLSLLDSFEYFVAVSIHLLCLDASLSSVSHPRHIHTHCSRRYHHLSSYHISIFSSPGFLIFHTHLLRAHIIWLFGLCLASTVVSARILPIQVYHSPLARWLLLIASSHQHFNVLHLDIDTSTVRLPRLGSRLVHIQHIHYLYIHPLSKL